jgi:hypothetical protein
MKNTTPPVAKGRTITRPNLLAYINAFELLMTADPFTKDEMLDVTGWHDTTATRFIKRLHARKLIYITAWLPDTMDRDAIPVYAKGYKPDKKRKRLSPAERSSRHRASVRNRRQQENMKGLFK